MSQHHINPLRLDEEGLAFSDPMLSSLASAVSALLALSKFRQNDVVPAAPFGSSRAVANEHLDHIY